MIKKFLKYWLPLCLYAGLIFYVSSIPKPLPHISIPYFDKFLHLIEYAIFGILAARAFKSSTQVALYKNFIMLSVLASVAYGASDELHQLFVSCRSCDAFDVTADLIGGTIGAIFYGKYRAF
ncbi:MAG: VanZ family protein [Candidatus Omnitrophica bacterium]|nr:VanZ family protein [Candidatus Omnitrophota bacterium]